MAIEIKHAGNAAPFAAGEFAGNAKRGIPQMQIPAWGGGSSASSSTSRRGRSKKTYNELLEEGLTTRPASTVATQAGFTGPTPVGAQRPNSVASQAGFAVAHNLDGTVNLTPQEIAANALKAGGRRVAAVSGVAPVATTSAQPTQALGKTWTDDKGNVWTNDSKGVPKVALKDAQDPLDAARLERSEYDYKQRMDRAKFDYEQTPLVDRQNPPKLVTSYGVEQNAQLDKLNRSYDDAVNSGKYSKSELIQLKNHVDYEKSKIRPTEKYETTMPWDEPREPDTPRDTSKDPGKIWVQGGSYMSRDEKGMPFKLGDVKDPVALQAKEQASEAKARDAERRKFFIESSKEMVTDPKGEKPPRRRTPEEIADYMKVYDDANSAYDNPTTIATAPSHNAAVRSPVTEMPEVKSATPVPTYAPATSPKDFKENTGLTIGEIGQALKSRGNLKDSRLDFKGLDPQRRAEIEQENKDLAELAQMTPVELYNMAAQQANEKQTSVAEQLRIVRDYISGR